MDLTTARLFVNIPTGATLTINGHPTTSKTATRLFITPPLQEPGYYDLRAEMTREGQTTTASQRVVVRPGEETRVSFDSAPEWAVVAP